MVSEQVADTDVVFGARRHLPVAPANNAFATPPAPARRELIIGGCSQQRRGLLTGSPAPAFVPGLPDPGRVRCPMQAHPPPGGLRDRLNPEHSNPTQTGWDSVTGNRQSVAVQFPPVLVVFPARRQHAAVTRSGGRRSRRSVGPPPTAGNGRMATMHPPPIGTVGRGRDRPLPRRGRTP